MGDRCAACGTPLATDQKYCLNCGERRGKPRFAPSSATTFATVSYAGTATVDGGTGAYKKAKGKGKMNCSSIDGVHFTCSDTAKVILPAPAS